MRRSNARTLTTTLTVAAPLTALTGRRAHAGEVIGTLAPTASPWGQVFTIAVSPGGLR